MRVPVLDTNTCHFGADRRTPTTVDVPAVTGEGALFAIRMLGDSMLGDDILDGDLLVFRSEAEATDGDVVLAALDGMLTVKRLRVRAPEVRLEPAHPFFTPVTIPREGATFLGVLAATYRDGTLRRGR